MILLGGEVVGVCLVAPPLTAGRAQVGRIDVEQGRGRVESVEHRQVVVALDADLFQAVDDAPQVRPTSLQSWVTPLPRAMVIW